jgi:molybdate transport system substrate-binding protein
MGSRRPWRCVDPGVMTCDDAAVAIFCSILRSRLASDTDVRHPSAGRYGRAALEQLGVWDSVKDHVVNARDVRSALAYVARQETPLGIVFDTDARLEDHVAVVGAFPAESHPPIVFTIAAVGHGRNPDTARILDFLVSPVARKIFESHGYAVLAPTHAR